MKIRIFAMMAMLLLCSACGTPENKPTETAGITKTETVEPEAVPDYLDTLPVYDLSGGSITEEAGKAFFLGCGGDMAIKTESGVELLMTTSSSIEILDHLHEMLTDPSVYCTDANPDKGADTNYKISFFMQSKTLFAAVPLQWAVLNLTDDDRARLRCVLLFEADYIWKHRAVQADPVSPNVPESNLWSGALLHRVALMYPDIPQVDEYRRHGTHLLLNSISVPSDAESDVLYDGKPMRDWFVGANFFESYALNHHGYMNVGYMVICLSNIAMLHFSGLISGYDTPAALYHHCEDLWNFVRCFVFDDGRLCRIGGDGRVRYCYCQDYLTPVFALVRNLFGENVDREENGWLSLLEKETEYNGDGSFLSERCELFRERSPLYYTRLESDRACTISMSCYWYRILKDRFQNATQVKSKDLQWMDEYHGSYYVRGKHRIAAFTWLASSKPQATVVPPQDSSMMEARFNMTNDIEGGGIMNHRTIKEHTGHLFPGGFITSGKFTYTTVGLLEENNNKNTNAINQIVVCALPDDRTVVTMQYCTALRRCWLIRVDPLYYHVPNDIFNDEKRIYTQKENSTAVDGILTAAAVYGGDIRVHKRTARTIGLQDISVPVADISECIVYRDRGMLRTDLLLIGGTDTPGWYDKDSVLFDFGAVFRTDDKTASAEAITDGTVRAVQILGDDGKLYVVIMNFGSSHVCGNAFQITYDLDGGMCAVYCEQTKL